MAEFVGFITNIKPEWMELAYNCRINGLSKEDAKPLIEEHAALTYKSKDNILKTRRVLERVFYDTDSWIVEDSLRDFRSFTESQKIALYWALLISTFPIFYDTCKAIGHLSEYRDVITITQTRQPVYDRWGARNIIHQSVKKVFQTLKDFGVLHVGQRPGTFTISQCALTDTKLVNYLTIAILYASGNSYLTWESIIGQSVLFPFYVEHVTQADAAACEKLTLERMGDDVVIRLMYKS